jgi:hypothetical protein
MKSYKKVICIDGSGYHLTNGKIYNVELVDSINEIDYYFVNNDINFRHMVECYRFQDLIKYRNKRIDEILY